MHPTRKFVPVCRLVLIGAMGNGTKATGSCSGRIFGDGEGPRRLSGPVKTLAFKPAKGSVSSGSGPWARGRARAAANVAPALAAVPARTLPPFTLRQAGFEPAAAGASSNFFARFFTANGEPAEEFERDGNRKPPGRRPMRARSVRLFVMRVDHRQLTSRCSAGHRSTYAVGPGPAKGRHKSRGTVELIKARTGR